MKMLQLRLGLLLGLLIWSCLPFAGAALSDEATREIERKLWVSGYPPGKLDGEEGSDFQEAVQKFLADEKLALQTSREELVRHLDERVERDRRKLMGPFETPTVFRATTLDSNDTIAVSAEDNLALAGDCSTFSKFQYDLKSPLGTVAPGKQGDFAYRDGRREVLCVAHWENGIYGILSIDVDTGQNLDFFYVSEGWKQPASLELHADSLYMVVDREQVVALDLSTRKSRAIGRIKKRGGGVFSAGTVISPDGSILLVRAEWSKGKGSNTVYWDTILAFDARNARLLYEFDVQGSSGMVISPDSSSFAVPFQDKRAAIYDLRSGKKSLRTNSRSTWAPPHSTADGKGIVFLTYVDRCIRRWIIQSNEVQQISCLENDGLSSQIFDLAHDRMFAILNEELAGFVVSTGKILPEAVSRGPERASILAGATSPSGAYVAVATEESVRIIEVDSGQVSAVPGNSTKGVTGLVFKSDDELVIARENGQIQTLNRLTGALSDILTLNGKITRLTGYGDTSRLVATLEADSDVRLSVIDPAAGRELLQKTVKCTLFGCGYGLVNGGSELIYGENWRLMIVNVETRKTTLNRELKVNVAKAKNRITWYKGTVQYVVGDVRRSRVYIAVSGVGQGLLYEYARGKLNIVEGSDQASGTNWIGASIELPFIADDAIYGYSQYDSHLYKYPFEGDLRYDSLDIFNKAVQLAPVSKGRVALIQINGEVAVYDFQPDSKTQYTTHFFKGGDWLTVSRDGHFAGATEAAKSFLVKMTAREVLPIDSFFKVLYRPDLVAAIASETERTVIEESGEKPVDFNEVVRAGLPPAVTVDLAGGAETVKSDRATVSATVTVKSGGLGKVEWRVNAITRVVMPAPTPAPADGATVTLSADLPLDPGGNHIEVSAYSAKSEIASIPATTEITSTILPESVKPRLFLISVGISKYWDDRLNLNFAATDASEIAAGLKTASAGLFDDTEITLLLDERATKAQIAGAFERIAREIRSSDVFVLFVAGHGKTSEGRYYFIPHDLRYSGAESLVAQGVNQDDWQGWMSRIAARKTLLLFDTCESGTLTMDKLTRGLDRMAALDQLTRATGRSIIAASSDDGAALEGLGGHGVFTYSILEGMDVDPARTGLVQVTQLASYVANRVPELSFKKFGVRQVPQMRLVGEDFAIGKKVAALAMSDEDFVPTQPTHVVLRPVAILDAQGKAKAVPDLPSGTLVRVVADKNGLAEIAREGKRLGFVPLENLARLQ